MSAHTTYGGGPGLEELPDCFKTGHPLLDMSVARKLGFISSVWPWRELARWQFRSNLTPWHYGRGNQSRRRAWGVGHGLSKRDLRGYERDQARFSREDAQVQTQTWSDAHNLPQDDPAP